MDFKVKSSDGKIHIVKIDEEDYSKIKDYNWRANKAKGYNYYYVVAHKNKKAILLHRLIMNVKKGCLIDHLNHDTLDNRKENLRICTYQQNMHNRKKIKIKTSKYKGVHFDKTKDKYIATIVVNKKRIKLGYFFNEENAALKYNEAAIKYFGQFALLNDLSDIINFPKEKNKEKKLSHRIYWHKVKNKWQVSFLYNKKIFHIGSFETKIDAINAHNETCDKYNLQDRKVQISEDK